MKISNLLLGKPLRASDERAEQIGPVAGIPIFGLDALSSAGYGPEAGLTILLPLGALGLNYVLPITLAIIVLLLIVFFSYFQTIAAYPLGGGSYTVARENLGPNVGVLAAAALMIDYILVVAVGISAGVGALVSAAPRLEPHTLLLCLVILVLIAFINLRGLREAGTVFMVPTYLFVGTLAIAVLIGVARALAAHGRPMPVIAPHALGPATAAAGGWILLQAFASGCTAMTGVEAVSNGVRAFRKPGTKNARITLTIIIFVLIALLAGIAYLTHVYQVGATDPGRPGYQSVLSQMLAAVAGRGWFYYLSMTSILLVLALSANTAFADFPRLCQIVALNQYLPSSFSSRGRRLVFSQGIYVLTFLAGVLLILFGGVTDRLIPLFAVGAFLAFTLSQAGMVAHWRRRRGRGWRRSMFINGLGAVATLITVLVVMVAKFTEGAWITVLLIPALVALMQAVRRRYRHVQREIALDSPLDLSPLPKPRVLVPIKGWNKPVEKALRFAYEISPEIKVVMIEMEETNCAAVRDRWHKLVVEPALAAGYPAPELEIVASPYRRVLSKLLTLAQRESHEHPGRQIAVVIPEVVEPRWYNYFLHNQRAAVLKAMLYFLGDERIVVVNVPWYLRAK